jgi:hypothetical protein
VIDEICVAYGSALPVDEVPDLTGDVGLERG